MHGLIFRNTIIKHVQGLFKPKPSMETRFIVLHIFLLAISFGGSFAQTSRKELRITEMNQDKKMRMSRPMQSKRIDPSQVIQLSWQPRVFLYRGFLSEEECDYLISRGDHSLKVDKNDANVGILLDQDDEIASRIEERISAWTFLPKENGKSLGVLHFGPEDSKRNYNYFYNKPPEQVGELLLATVVLYLSNVSHGGQILLHESENKMWSDCMKISNILRPSKGNAIVLFNLHLNATLDRSSFHARCPVLTGEMWCATKLFYLKGISNSIHNDSSQSNDANCTDEDENCPRWAAVGECQRNSVFMIGSPDYYGTCRKSCNAC